jgi:hypothetical protein
MSGQSGRIIGTIAGAALAYFTGGASYVAIGATLGGAVGSLLDPKQKIEGPRLEDLKVQVSTYGIGIPTLYGTERFGGNVIWSTDKLEIANIESQGGGKGGGTESTSYKYYVHMRQILCATPRNGAEVSLVKIFQDGKLIWDMSSGIPAGSALASEENLYASFILYQGHQDQLPNAEEEAWHGGPGSVSAYRGVVSIYMRAIECPGGRVPQFSFVLSNGAAVSPEVSVLVDLPTVDDTLTSGGGVIRADGVTHFSTDSGSGQFTTRHWFASSGASTPMGMVAPYSGGGYYPYPVGGATPNPWTLDTKLDGKTYLTDLSSGARSLWLDVEAGTPGTGANTPGASGNGRAYYDETDGALVLSSWTPSGASPPGTTWLVSRIGGTPTPVSAIPTGDGKGPVVAYFRGVVYLVSVPSGGTGAVLSRRTSTGEVDVLMPTTTDLSVDFSGRWSALYVDATGVYLYCVPAAGGNASIYKIRPASIVDPVGAFEMLAGPSDGVPGSGSVFNAVSRTFYCSDSIAIIGPLYGGSYLGYSTIRFSSVSVAEVKAKDIIADQIELSGATSYDVSALPDSDTLYGYKIAGPASARANIEPILTAFGYYVVDEDGSIKVKRYADITSVADVSFDELGQAEAGGDPSDAMPLNRTQEVDLARSVTVSYIEPTSDFQTASETEIRQVTDSTEDMQIQLPVCFSSDKAKRVAQMALYDQHRRQNTRSLTVSRKFAAVSPGDGVTVEYPRGAFKLWLVLSTNDTGAVCEWSVVPGDASIFTQTAIGATGYTQQEVAPLAPPSKLVLLDMPILRDVDSDAGKYAAIMPLGDTGWRGASVLISDDDLTYADKASITTQAVTGFAETTLADGPFFQIDHKSTVTVNVGSGELNTVTWDALFASGTTNLAALTANFETVGFPDARVEIFQFRVATSLGDGRYVLSELVRGLYGTERVAYNHGVSDTFILLNGSGMGRLSMEPGAIGSTKFYKAVSFGRSANSIAGTSSETIGYGLKPLSPVNVKLDRTPADGSVAFTWGRRTRMSHNALRQVMPLGESAEAYEVVIYTDTSYDVVKSIYRIYTPAFTYTSAQLAADGKSQLGVIPYRIYQLSDTAGRGVPFQPGQGLL